MLADAPKSFTWISFALLTGAMLEFARRSEPDGWRGLALFVAVIFAAAAIVNGLYWMVYRVVAQFRMVVMAQAETERVLVMRVISQMNEAQLHYLETVDPMVITLPGSAGPIVMLMRISGMEIPYDFIAQFFEQSQGAYLVPVGSFAEGTKARQWAVALTGHFVRQGFAERASGNHSARWVDRAAAERWVNLPRLRELAA